jgi:outer membrane biosynthesis protein TonB
MNLRQIIPSDVTASAVAHLSLLALLLLFSDVRPFGAVPSESIPVDIVAPPDIPEKAAEQKPEPVPTPTPTPQLSFAAQDKPAPEPVAQQPPPSSPPPRPQKQAAVTLRPSPQPTAAPPPAAQPQATPQPQAAPAPAYRPPEPDVTQKYGVLLGLPPYIDPNPSAAAPSGARAGDNFDGPANQNADVASSVISAFRRHLRSCSKLPAGLKGTDDVKVKLRVMLGQDGKLTAEPQLIEASASMKGPLLMQGAIKALQACQPYAMLPADRYGEWKVLDLSFTPQDFAG